MCLQRRLLKEIVPVIVIGMARTLLITEAKRKLYRRVSNLGVREQFIILFDIFQVAGSYRRVKDD